MRKSIGDTTSFLSDDDEYGEMGESLPRRPRFIVDESSHDDVRISRCCPPRARGESLPRRTRFIVGGSSRDDVRGDGRCCRAPPGKDETGESLPGRVRLMGVSSSDDVRGDGR